MTSSPDDAERARLAPLLILLVLLAPFGAKAQIVEVGSSGTLDIATWNIEWFGHPGLDPSDDAQQVANVADIMLGTGIDIWALQEITDNSRFEELVAQLGNDWDGILGQIPAFNRTQRLAYVWNTQVASLRQQTHILQSSDFYFAGRPPLKATFDVSLGGEDLKLTLINVHMKAGGAENDYERRLVAASRVKIHVDFTALDTEPVLFLGDFNDELEASTYRRSPSPYAPFLADPEGFTALSLPLEQAGLFTHVGGSTLDHIVASNEMFDRYVAASTDRMASLLSVNGFAARTSDHLPVFASFNMTVGSVGVEQAVVPGQVPTLDGDVSVYPNPAASSFTLRFSSPHESARVSVYDMLGRSVLAPLDLPAGRALNEIAIDAAGLAPGIYLVWFERASERLALPLVVRR